MPFHGEMFFPHKAVLWTRIGTDENARPIVSSVAEEIDCRWDGRRRNVAGPDGEPITVDATVSINREIRIGSAMYKGRIDDLPGTGQTPERNVYEVVSYEAVDDIRGMNTYHEIGLVKGSDTLPDTGTDPEN